jgi:hypothetical protein
MTFFRGTRVLAWRSAPDVVRHHFGRTPAGAGRVSDEPEKDGRPLPMARCLELFKRSGLSLDELGRRMGYDGGTARKAACSF